MKYIQNILDGAIVLGQPAGRIYSEDISGGPFVMQIPLEFIRLFPINNLPSVFIPRLEPYLQLWVTLLQGQARAARPA